MQSRVPPIDPDAARAQIAALLPKGTTNRDGWAVDIFAAFEALHIEPSRENTCAVVAVAQQESGLQANPVVPGLAQVARKEIDARAARLHVPQFLVNAALNVTSPNGRTYAERLETARTEKDLNDVFEDFIGMVPLGGRLFADWNPVRTGGPMQVSIAYAEKHARDERYPYPVAQSIRREVFTRRGGLYFGIAHLLDYPADYDAMIYRFADFNAGHYASRNAAFQNALNIASRSSLALDGDLLTQTELAARKIGTKLEMSESEIKEDLAAGSDENFERTHIYRRVFELADKARGRRVPRAMIPQIRLRSAKITRKLTTRWFAERVDSRYRQCLSR
jgi:hypothetical protein